MAGAGAQTAAGRLGLLVAAAGCLAAGCVLTAAVTATRVRVPAPGWAVLCVVLVYVGVTARVRTRLGAQRLELTWSEAALMVALTLVPPAWVVLLTPVGVAVRVVGRQPLVKIAYNLSSYTVAAAAAAAIVGWVRPATVDAVGPAVALVAAGVVGGLVSHVAVAVVIAVAQDMSVLASWRAGAGLQLLSVVGNVAAALVVLLLARHDPRLIAALPLVGLCLHQGYVGRLRGREERIAAARQLDAVNALAADLDEAGVARRAAAEIAALLVADTVEVALHATSARAALSWQQARRGGTWSGPPQQAPAVVGRLVTEVPIGVGADCVGQVRVWLAGNANLQLSDRDELTLQTLAAALHTALANARAHEQLREVADRQAYQATHDGVTGLPTHEVLQDMVDAHLAQVRTGGAADPIALCMIDITAFRETVHTLGRAAAHHLLAHAADQMRATAAVGEHLAHVGSDSFAVFIPRGQDPEQIRGRVHAMLAAIGTPVRLEAGGGQLSLHATAGIAYCATPAAASGAELLRQATVALDHARALDLQIGWYDPGTDIASPSALVLASELRSALGRHDELELHYQPIVDLAGRWPVAVEALARWRHPTHGLLHPRHFVPVLHRSPRDHARFLRWYLDTALRERSQWGGEDLPVAVTLDARSLLDRDLVEHVAAALGRVDLNPNQLMFELAETTALSTLDTADQALAELQHLGVRIAIGNFGSDHSSLTRLLRVPATHLQIAAELTADMISSEQATTIVRAAIDIGPGLGLHVTALGVTSDTQAAKLIALGCPAGQGPHLVPPLTSSRLRHYLANAPTPPVRPDAEVIVLKPRRAAADRDQP